LGNGETVLVVEDNPKLRKLSIKRIRDLGYKTLEAANGDIAYKMLKDGAHANILCSDLAMLGLLNGYDLAAKIATDFPDLKVLITSGHARDVVTDTLTHDTSFDILHKPYRQSDLAERLYALLAGSTDV
jgi:CheY-like chemotaxis protein